METVIFGKCCDFAKMLCFAVFLAKMPSQECFVFNQHSLVKVYCVILTKIFMLASATRVRAFYYFLAQYM